ncbi:hypothetical protein Pla110_05630 [Polystyrenella longa]|uniref:Uncharacterized protein n=1 Tax=Polystyrenella longa TaxID=2528007 RepID=A0A518CHZ6_9PLAN|nr:hypothetical protein [Polystyrenella longa]QDU78859.1 hypothetical protein Pla110_05630 [Polystyrenella longa]
MLNLFLQSTLGPKLNPLMTNLVICVSDMTLKDISVSPAKEIEEFFENYYRRDFIHVCDASLMHFVDHLRREKFDTGNIRKVNILLFNKTHNLPSTENIHDYGLGILEIFWTIDLTAYSSSSPYDKKCMILSSMIQAMEWLSSIYEWNTKSLRTAYQKCIDEDMKYIRLSKTTYAHPTNEFNVRLLYDVEPEITIFYAVLFKHRSKKELQRIRLGTTESNWGCLLQLKQHAGWVDESRFRMKVRDGHGIYWEADFSDFIT